MTESEDPTNEWMEDDTSSWADLAQPAHGATITSLLSGQIRPDQIPEAERESTAELLIRGASHRLDHPIDYAPFLAVAGLSISAREFDIHNLRSLTNVFRVGRQLVPNNSELVATSCHDEALAWVRLGDLGEEPEDCYHKAAELYYEAAGKCNSGSFKQARCLDAAATSWQSLAQCGVDSVANFQKSIELHAKAAACFPSDKEHVGQCLMNQANACFLLGQEAGDETGGAKDAISLYTQATSLLRPGSRSSGLCLMNAANAHVVLGNSGNQPERNYLKAISICAEAIPLLKEKKEELGGCLVNQAIAHQRLGAMGIDPLINYNLALEHYSQATNCLSEGSFRAGTCMMNQGIVCHRLADHGVEPLKNYRRAVALYRQAAPIFPNGNKRATCWMEEGISTHCLGEQGDEPMRNYQRAIALYRDAFAEMTPGTKLMGNCLMNEGISWESLSLVGDFPQASLWKASALFDQAATHFDQNSLSSQNNAYNHARVLSRLSHLVGEVSEMADLRRRAYRIMRDTAMPVLEHVSQTFYSERNRNAYRETNAKCYRLMIQLCLELAAVGPDESEAEALRWEAWQWVQRSKARTLQEALANLRQDAVRHDPAVAAQLEAAMAEFSQLSRGSGKEDEAQSQGRNDGAADAPGAEVLARITSVVAQLMAATTHLPSHPLPEPVPLAQQLRALASPQEVVLVVEFFPRALGGAIGVFVHPAGSASGLETPVWLSGGLSTALALAQEVWDATAVISRSGDVRARNARATGGQPQPSRDQVEEAQAIMNQLPQALGELLAPLRERIEQRGWQGATLILCPTGNLHHLPLAAAQWGTDAATGQALHLIDCHPLMVLPTAALAEEVVQRSRANTIDSAEPAAFVAAADPAPLRALPSAYDEAAHVASVLQGAKLRVETRLSSQATVQSIRDFAPSSQVVHLAMHSDVSPQRFELSGMEFHDRRLTVLELLLFIRLQRARLAFIATCNSGQARDLHADDPSAITRAWMLAGAPTIIGGLWPLDDEAAYRFAREFYNRWAAGDSAAKAFQAAMIYVRDHGDGGSPMSDLYRWAPFLLAGNGGMKLVG